MLPKRKIHLHPAKEAVIFNFARQQFRTELYPQATGHAWKNWRWQIANSVTTIDELHRVLGLTKEERDALQAMEVQLPLRITPYYAAIIRQAGRHSTLRKSVVPSAAELVITPGEEIDPLGEEHDTKVPGLVHRYPDRVLVLLTDFCSSNCRYCTRSRMVGQHHFACNFERVVEYIQSHPEVRDVLLSGGDPLTLPDNVLEHYLQRLRQISHVEIIRIGSKVPAVLPQRITPRLVSMLKKYHPLYINLHFIHPDEITDECRQACIRLTDAGIPLGSQTVLLKGINDDAEVLKKLFHKLLECRVKPYYLYQCDPIAGSAHFRTTVEAGIQIIRQLRGFTTGMAVPTYVIDAPGGGGKIPIQPDYLQGRDERGIVLRNYENREFVYPADR